MRLNIELDLTKAQGVDEVAEVDKRKISTAEEAISFSKAIISLLKTKGNAHNSTVNGIRKVNLPQLKKVYLRGAEHLLPEKTRGQAAMARVNLYLRILSANDLGKVVLQDADSNGKQSWEIDLTSAWKPSEEDIQLAEKECLAYDVDYNFDNNDLYFTDESPLAFANALRNLL